MVWKSNISSSTIDYEAALGDEVSSLKFIEDKENRQQEAQNSSETVDARSSENYLQNEEVIEV